MPRKNVDPRVPQRDFFITIVMWGVGIVAAVASWSGWVGLAEKSGFDQSFVLSLPWGAQVEPSVSWIYGVCVDLFAAGAIRIWRVVDWSPGTRKLARRWAFTTIGVGVVANSTFHLLNILRIDSPAFVVVIFSAVPPIMLGVVVHLAVLYSDDLRQAASSGDGTVSNLASDGRPSLLLRGIKGAFDAVGTVRTSYQELRRGDAPAEREGSEPPPARPEARPRVAKTLAEAQDKSQQMRNYYLSQLAAGWPDTDGKPLTGADLDRRFGGKTLGRVVIRRINEEQAS